MSRHQVLKYKAKKSQEPSTQAPSQATSASGGQYCFYQKPKQVTCNVAHMKRVTHQFKYYCGTQSQQNVCTGHRCVTIITELDHEQTQKTYAQIIYRKIPKISPGGYIFQKPFLRAMLVAYRWVVFRGCLNQIIQNGGLLWMLGRESLKMGTSQ